MCCCAGRITQHCARTGTQANAGWRVALEAEWLWLPGIAHKRDNLARAATLVTYHATNYRSGCLSKNATTKNRTRNAPMPAPIAVSLSYFPKRAFASFKQLVFASPAKASHFSFATA